MGQPVTQQMETWLGLGWEERWQQGGRQWEEGGWQRRQQQQGSQLGGWERMCLQEGCQEGCHKDWGSRRGVENQDCVVRMGTEWGLGSAQPPPTLQEESR